MNPSPAARQATGGRAEWADVSALADDLDWLNTHHQPVRDDHGAWGYRCSCGESWTMWRSLGGSMAEAWLKAWRKFHEHQAAALLIHKAAAASPTEEATDG